MRTARGGAISDSDEIAERLPQELDLLAPVQLKALERALLHDRVESKVVLRAAGLPAAIGRLADDYLVLDHLDSRIQGYRSHYFDSADLRSYREHHNKNGRRLKLRYRTYLNSDITFFEVKRKVHGRTVKERQLSRSPVGSLWSEDAAFVREQTGWDPASLAPSLVVDYRRILLVRRDFGERVTIDLDVTFTNHRATAELAGLCICEFKQTRLDLRSPAVQAMKSRPQSFSKYCIGLAACEPGLRRNRFKPTFRSLEALHAPMAVRATSNADLEAGVA